MPGSGNKGDRSDGGSGGFGGGGNVAGGRGGEGGGTKANFKGGDTVSAVGGNWARIGNFIGNPDLGPSTSATGLTREQALGLVGTPAGKKSGLNTAMAMGMYGGLPAAPAPAAPARPAPMAAPPAPPIAAPPPAPTPQLAPPPAVAPPASLVSQAFNTSPSLSSPNLAPPNPGTFGIMSSSQVPGAPAPASPAMASMAPASMSTKSPAPADSHTPASISPARRDTTMSSGIAALGAGYMGQPVGAPQGGLVGPSKDQSRIGPAPAKDQSRIGGMPGVSSHSMNMGMADFARPGDPGVAGVPGGVQGRGLVGVSPGYGTRTNAGASVSPGMRDSPTTQANYGPSKSATDAMAMQSAMDAYRNDVKAMNLGSPAALNSGFSGMVQSVNMRDPVYGRLATPHAVASNPLAGKIVSNAMQSAGYLGLPGFTAPNINYAAAKRMAKPMGVISHWIGKDMTPDQFAQFMSHPLNRGSFTAGYNFNVNPKGDISVNVPMGTSVNHAAKARNTFGVATPGYSNNLTTPQTRAAELLGALLGNIYGGMPVMGHRQAQKKGLAGIYKGNIKDADEGRALGGAISRGMERGGK
jgi:hypothetical protein